MSRGAVIFTGGTISMETDSTAGGKVPRLNGAAIIAHGDLAQDVGSGADLEYNLPPPPQPKLNFATEIKMAFASFLHLG